MPGGSGLKTVWVDEEVWRRLVALKYQLGARSINDVLRRLLEGCSALEPPRQPFIPASQYPSSLISQHPTSPLSQQPSSPVGQQPTSPTSQQSSSPEPAARRGEGKTRRRSPLDEVEDIEVIRARKPEALRRTAEESGLRVRDLAEDGYPGLVAVYKQSFADFAKTVAETERPTLQQVEERAQKALRRGRLTALDDKVAVMLYILNREGEILWDGKSWVEPGRARPAPPLQEQLRQLREREQQEKQQAGVTAVSPEKPAPQQAQQQQRPQPPQQPQAPQQLDERVRRWLELFEKEFPRLKTAMLVWSVKDAEALRRLAEHHGLVYYAITAEKAVVLNRDYVKDACAYANERRWTREKVADIVADTLRSKPHAPTDEEIAALTLEAALSLGMAEYRGGGWHAK